MTSACGVVEEVNTDESALYEGRVDRKVRAAIKGQTAITVEFVNGANRAFVEDIEKALNLYGIHTYLHMHVQIQENLLSRDCLEYLKYLLIQL